MTNISKDQAVTAMMLWEHFVASPCGNTHIDQYLSTYDAATARYAVVEMAKDVEKIFDLLPDAVQAFETCSNRFHTIILNMFDYTSGPVPKLKRDHESIAQWYVVAVDMASHGTEPNETTPTIENFKL